MEEALDPVELAAIARATNLALRTTYHPAWTRDDLYQQGAIAVLIARRRRDPTKHGAQRHVWLRRVAWGAMVDAIRTEVVREGGHRSREGGGRIQEGSRLFYAGQSVFWAMDDGDSSSFSPSDNSSIRAATEEGPEHALRDKQQALRAAKRLSPRLRQILAMLLRGDTLSSIAAALRVTESRICQVKAEIVAALEEPKGRPAPPRFNFSAAYIAASNAADNETVLALERYFAIDDETVRSLRLYLEANHAPATARPAPPRLACARSAGEQQRHAG